MNLKPFGPARVILVSPLTVFAMLLRIRSFLLPVFLASSSLPGWGATVPTVPAASTSTVFHAFETIEAESGSISVGSEVVHPEPETGFVHGLGADQWVGFEQVYFDRGARGFEARVAIEDRPGTLEIRIGGPQGPKIGSVEVEPRRGWQTVRGSMWRVTGVQPVYLSFRDAPDARLDWVRFRSHAGESDALLEEEPPERETTLETQPVVQFDAPTTTPPEEAPGPIVEAATEAFDERQWFRFEAEEAERCRGLKVRTDDAGDSFVARIRSTSWLKYPGVRFAEGTVMRLRVANRGGGDRVEVRLGSLHAEPVAVAGLPISSGIQQWETIDIPLEGVPPGVHDAYLVFINQEQKLYSGIPESLLNPYAGYKASSVIARLDWIALDTPQTSSASLAVAR